MVPLTQMVYSLSFIGLWRITRRSMGLTSDAGISSAVHGHVGQRGKKLPNHQH